MPCFDPLEFFKSSAYSKKSLLSEENQDFGGAGVLKDEHPSKASV